MELFIRTYCHITDKTASVNGQKVPVSTEDGRFLADLYRTLKIDYPKFFKMDNLSKLGFLAAELIFKDNKTRFTPREDLAIICFNRSSSLDTDVTYQNMIQQGDNYFPSPSVFVYTLPNIVTAEIAIRNKLFGETSFYLSEQPNAEEIFRTVKNAFQDKTTSSALVAWVEYFENTSKAVMMLVEPDKKWGIPFTINQIVTYINQEKMDELILKLKQEIIEVLNLEDVKPEDIADDSPLFGEGLGLDSIDALELIVLMEKSYGIKLKDASQGREIFKSVKVMAAYIQENRTK